MTLEIDQSNASAGGDVVAGNKKVIKNFYAAPNPSGVVEQLLNKLQAEMHENEEVKHRIENLQYFYERKSIDGVDGLEAKLTAENRNNELYLALEKKEHFVKLLEKWSLYASAQEIFAFFLAKIEYEFSTFIFPKISTLGQSDIDQLINDRIVVPTISECGASVFTLNHVVVMGMIYWLAEQCFVRWHQ
jgi:hypothetical protein